MPARTQLNLVRGKPERAATAPRRISRGPGSSGTWVISRPADGTPPRYCLITQVSNGGVRINTFGVNIPDEFALLLSGDGPAIDGTYRVIWRVGYDVGAQLVS